MVDHSRELDAVVTRGRQDMVLRGETPPPLPAGPLTVADLTGRRSIMQQVIKQVMKEGTHYGVIPGTKKRTLLKEGAEILLSTFRISVEPEVEDLSTADVVRYRVRCVGREIGSGLIVGFGLGGCSSNEDKYKWRRPVCQEEFEETDERRRRHKWFKGNPKPFKDMQVRTNPEEVANTILKMAKKRAQIDLCLTALAASEAFSDLPPPPKSEGAPALPRDSGRTAPGASTAVSQNPPADPKVQPGSATAERPATAAQLGLLKKKIDQVGISENYFLAQFELGQFEELPFAKMDEALAWIAGQDQGPQ